MRVLSINAGADTGGNGYNIARGFDRHPQDGILFQSTVSKSNYIRYPDDLPWPQAARAWKRADVHHFHNSTRTRKVMGGQVRPFVLQHHGTHYRNHADALNAEITAATVPAAAVVSTLDLLDYGPNLTWTPQVADLDRIATLRNPVARPHKLRVGHAPTDRAIKSTDAFLAACAKLNVEPVLIERQSWDRCLRVKGTVDIFFDQVLLGYGNNAIEAWAMGIPVICGGAPGTLDRMRATFGELPFVEATVDTIGDAIRFLMDDTARLEWGKRGHDHAVTWHNGRETVTRLARIYRGLTT